MVMSLPINAVDLEQLLSHYQLQWQQSIAWPQQGVIAQLFEDDMGRVVVLCGQDSLIDLNRLRKLTGRFLFPAKPERLQSLLLRLQMDILPAFPELHGLETLVDRRLLQLDQWSFRLQPHQWLTSLHPQALLSQCQVQVLPFAEVLLPHPQDWQQQLQQDQQQINQAVTRFTAKRIQQRLDETLELPPLSQTARAILDLRNDPNADAVKLAAIIEADASLAAQVVGWAANAYFSAPGKVRSVQDAVVRVLGYELVMNLALGLSLGSCGNQPDSGDGASTPYWEQSMMMASVMNGLNRLIPEAYRPSYGLVYLTGLLHNFGHLVLASVFKPQFAAINPSILANSHLDPSRIEQQLLGISREQIASVLLGNWRLPAEVITGIRFMQQPEYLGVHADYAQLAALALRLLRFYGLLSGPVLAIDESLFEGLQIAPKQAEDFMLAFCEKAPEIRASAAMLMSR